MSILQKSTPNGENDVPVLTAVLDQLLEDMPGAVRISIYDCMRRVST